MPDQVAARRVHDLDIGRNRVSLTFALPLLLVAGTLVTTGLTALEWRSDGKSDRMARAGRVYLTLLVVAFVALLWQLQYWNLVTAAL